MSTVGDALQDVASRLTGTSSDAPRLEARLLVEAALGQPRVWLYQNPTAPIEPKQAERLRELVERRLTGEPLAYLLGVREFYGRPFSVDQRVLIPRPETEVLLEHALAFVRRRGSRRSLVVDVGTGSGILGISMALEIPSATIVMIDRSAAALSVARENCRLHSVQDRVTLVEGDLLEPLAGPVDLVLANLPYIPTTDLARLHVEVQREPRAALDGGPDGLALYRRLLAQLPDRLAPDGAAFLEIGDGQGPRARELAQARLPERAVAVLRDLEGRDRVVAVTPHPE